MNAARFAEWCTLHDQPRAKCRPDQAHKWAFFVRGDLLAAATRQARDEGTSLNKIINRGLAREIGFTSPAGMTAEEFTAEFASLEAARQSMLTGKQELFAAALGQATEEKPVTFADLQAATDTGSSNSYVSNLLAAVLKAGAVGRKAGKPVLWWALPGADIRAAMRGKAAESPQAAPGRQSPAPASRKPAASATRTGKGKNAATKKTPRKPRAAVREQAPAAARPPVAAESRESVITELKARVPDLVTASELPVPVFLAGPDVDCVHENMRLRKGVCPDCKQWVTK